MNSSFYQDQSPTPEALENALTLLARTQEATAAAQVAAGDAAALAAAALASMSSPRVISRRQFFHQLALSGTCTQLEALAAMQNGAIPAVLQALVNALPDEQQFSASMMIMGNNTFERDHPFVIAFGAAFGWTPEQIDEFWAAAIAL
jgi:hypothetical protein